MHVNLIKFSNVVTPANACQFANLKRYMHGYREKINLCGHLLSTIFIFQFNGRFVVRQIVDLGYSNTFPGRDDTV